MEIADHLICFLRNLYAGQEATVRIGHGYLAYTQSTSCKMPGWMKLKQESKLPGEMSITSDMQMTLPYGRKLKGIKEILMKMKEESEKADLKLNIQKPKIMASSPISSVQSLSRVQLFATP